MVYNPPSTTSKSGIAITGLSIAASSTYYLLWHYVGSGGSTNAQALGFDNFSLLATLASSGGGSIFDTNGATAASGATAGTYNWSAANWSASAAGTDATGNYIAGVATFAAGTDATGSITVNVDTAVSASGLSFEEGSFTIANASGGTLTLTGSATATVASSVTASISQAVGGTAGFAKAGAGTLNLSAGNTYTGATAINDGTLVISGGDAIPNTSAVTLANASGAVLKLGAGETFASLAGGGATGGNVNLQGNTLTLAGSSNTSFAGVISGTSGSLVKSGSANLTLTGDNTYTGLTDVQAGTLTLDRSGGAINNSAPVQISGGTLAVAQSDTVGAVTLVSGTISGAGTLTGSSFAVQSGTIGAPLGGAATLTKTTAGSVSLTGDNTYTGLTDVQAGTLTLNRSGGAIANASAVQVSGGTLAVTQSDTVGAVTLVSGTISGAGTLTGSSYAVQSGTVSAPLGGSGGLTKSTSGTVTLSGANTFSGATSISAGTLALSGGGVLSSSSGLSMTGGTFDISGITAGSTTISALSGSAGAVVRMGAKSLTVGDGSLTTFGGTLESTSGSLAKAGAGTFNLTQSNPGFGGGASVSAGTLALGASNALGAAGQIAVTGESTLLGAAGTTQANPISLTSSLGTATVLAYWNFNALSIATASAPGSGGVPLSIAANSGSGTLSLASWGGTVDDFNGDTINVLFSNPAEESLSLIAASGVPGNNTPLLITGLDFTGYTDARVTFAGRGTAAGFSTGQWAYSTDGSQFTNFGANTATTSTNFSLKDTGNTSGLDNSATASLRYVLSGATDTLGNNRIDNLQVLGYANALVPTIGTAAASGTVTFSGDVTLSGQANFEAPTGATAAFSGNIVNGGSAGTLIKTGGGTVQLTGGNTYSGATRINAGTLSTGGTGIGDFSAIILSDVGGAQLVLTGSEQVGSLSGGGSTGGNVNLGANQLTVGNDNTSTSFAGVVSGVGGSLNKRGAGTFNLTAGNTFTGGVTLNNGTLVVPSVALNGTAQPLGAAGTLTMENATSLVITGVGGMNRNLLLTGSAATVSVGTTVDFAGAISNTGNTSFTKTGAGTFNLTGSGDWNGDNVIAAGAFAITGSGGINGNTIGAGSLTVANGATLAIDTTGQVRATSVTAQTGGVVQMEAGVLRTNTLSMNGSGTFNWQGGTLTTYSPVIIGTGTDVSASGGAGVYQGRELVVNGNLRTGADSVLDLGDLYTAGATVYNSITINGTLNLNAVGDTLKLFTTPYLLRASNGGTLSDSGTIPLLTATGGITGVFENLLLPLPDGRVFNQYVGFWPLSGNPAHLPVDTFYVEQTATQILFHYNVSSAIPEPATGGMVLAGVMGLRILGAARRRRQEGEGARGTAPLARWARSARRRFRRHS